MIEEYPVKGGGRAAPHPTHAPAIATRDSERPEKCVLQDPTVQHTRHADD